GDEHADEWRPGYPPAPVEYRPAVLPFGVLVGLVPCAEAGELLHVVADVLDERVEDEQRRPDQQDEEQQRSSNDDVDLAQPLDARIQTAHDGPRRERGDADDQGDLDAGRLRYAEQMLETGVDLLDAESERRRD